MGQNDTTDRHEKGRIVGFSDGIVAVAITLLVLPLTAIDIPRNDQQAIANPIGYVLDNYNSTIISFVISWFVIAQFWFVHHRLFDVLAYVNSSIIYWNFLWLFGIVLLPFTSSVLSQTEGQGARTPAVALYMGNMLFISFLLYMITWSARRSPHLWAADREIRIDKYGLVRGRVFPCYLALLFVFSLVKPEAALYGLIGLAFIGPFSRFLVDSVLPKTRSKTAPDSEGAD